MSKLVVVDENKEHYGILIYISTLFFFAAMEAQAKYLSDNYTVIQIVWARYTFHFVVITLALLLLKIFNFRIDFKKPRLLKVQILRSISLLLMTYFFFASLSKLPIAEATLIIFASPLITIVLSPWLLKEKVNFSTWLAVIIGFIGMIIVINPNSFSEISGIDRDFVGPQTPQQ